MKKHITLLFMIIATLCLSMFFISCGEKEDKAKLSLNKTSVNMILGFTDNISATYNQLEGYSLSWSSSDDSIVSVKNGALEAMGLGNATVTATYSNGSDNYTASANISVGLGGLVPTLCIENYINEDTWNIVKGDSVEFKPYVFFNGVKFYDVEVSISTSNDAVISYANNIITALNVGNTNIVLEGNWRGVKFNGKNAMGISLGVNVSNYFEVLLNNDALVNEIVSTTEGETYSISLSMDGAIIDSGFVVTSDKAVVSISADYKTITVLPNSYGVANVNISYDDKIIKTYSFMVDTKEGFTSFGADVAFSKSNGKLFFSDEAKAILGEPEILDVMYDFGGETGKVSIFDNGVIDATNIPVTDGTLGNTECQLYVNTTIDKYEFSNVKVYDQVFENTKESREALVKLLKGSLTEETTGCYALAEDLYFESETFETARNGSEGSVFSATFDGRGYSLNNVNFGTATGTRQAIFGYYAGECTLKNFAINGIISKGDYFGGLFFYAPAGSMVTIENVYIYRYVTESKDANALFIYGASSGSYGTWKMSNVIVEQEFASGLAEKKNDIFSTQAATIAGEISDVYFITNGGNKGATSADGNLKYYRATDEGSTLADAREQMVQAGNSYDTFSEDYWTTDADGLPVWKALQTTAE